MAGNFNAYVNSYTDLTKAFDKYKDKGGDLNKTEWGQKHWNTWGQNEARTLPGILGSTTSSSQTVYTPGINWGNNAVIKAGTYSQQEYDVLSAGILTQLQGNINKEIESIRAGGMTGAASIQAGAAVNVANIQAGANKYIAELDLQARKYLADKDYLKGVDVEKIKAQNNLDLQAVINAGLKEVEGIRGQTAKDVANIQGEFGVKQESTRQAGQKEIARINEQAGFRNALIGAFSF